MGFRDDDDGDDVRREAATSVPAALALSLLAACTPAPAAETIAAVDGAQAMEEVRNFVAVGPRVSGTAGAAAAAAYLANRLAALGLTPETDVFESPIRGGTGTFRNVTATLPGASAERLVLLSHYDTKGGIGETFIGANDSGSSTGLLLALVPRLKAAAYPFGIILAFVDGEECVKQYAPNDGLHGSRRLVSRLAAPGEVTRIRAVIVLDMVGDRDLTITIPRNSTPELVRHALDAAKAVGARERFRLLGSDILDDHVPFLDAGIPAIDLIDFEHGSRPGRNNYWHTTEDTMDKLSPESLATVGAVVLRMLEKLASR